MPPSPSPFLLLRTYSTKPFLSHFSPSTATAATSATATGSGNSRSYFASQHHQTRCFSSLSKYGRPCCSSGSSGSGSRPVRRYSYPSEAQAIKAAREAYDAVINKSATSGKREDDRMVRCIVLNENGEVDAAPGKFRKLDLCQTHKIDPRDLRKIDSLTPNVVPTILVRDEAILVTVLHIRALVKANQVILFDTIGSKDSRLASAFLYNLQHNLKTKKDQPYEFRALETILTSACSALEAEMVYMREVVGNLLGELEVDIGRGKLRSLLHYNRRLTGFSSRANGLLSAIDEVLESDEDLTAMYLTDKLERDPENPRTTDDHTEIEILLESVSKQVEEVTNELEDIMANVQSTQEIVDLMLDANRNKLMGLELRIAIVTMGIGSGALLAGLFGMNLTTKLEEHPYAFAYVSVGSFALSLLVTLGGLRHLAKVRRVGLSDSGAARSPPPPPVPACETTPHTNSVTWFQPASSFKPPPQPYEKNPLKKYNSNHHHHNSKSSVQARKNAKWKWN